MNCPLEIQLDLYAEGELPVEEVPAVEEHLARCGACRRRLANLREVTALLQELPAQVPAPDLADRVVAVVQAQELRTRVRRPWLRVALVGLAASFSTLLLVGLGYETALGLQQGGVAQFIALLISNPEFLTRYPAEGFYAILESLPLTELVFTLGTALIVIVLVEQLLRTLTPWVQLNGNHYRQAT